VAFWWWRSFPLALSKVFFVTGDDFFFPRNTFFSPALLFHKLAIIPTISILSVRLTLLRGFAFVRTPALLPVMLVLVAVNTVHALPVPTTHVTAATAPTVPTGASASVCVGLVGAAAGFVSD